MWSFSKSFLICTQLNRIYIYIMFYLISFIHSFLFIAQHPNFWNQLYCYWSLITQKNCFYACFSVQVLVLFSACVFVILQDGVNWLSFLNKYKLHGILCDDMGLGKTLQSICILAGDHYLRYRVTASAQWLTSTVIWHMIIPSIAALHLYDL